MVVTGNGIDGVAVLDGRQFLRVLNSTIANNGRYGVACAASCHVEGNIVSENASGGVSAYSGIVLGNTILKNGDVGLFGGQRLAYGNNAISENNNGGDQTIRSFLRLFPNACHPAPCP
jgi:hypothetical protein